MNRAILFSIALLAAAVSAPAQRISLAVTAIEPIGVRGDTAKIVEQIVQEEFANVPLFQLVERGRLDLLLKEQELQVGGITSAESAVRAGNVLNVQKVVFGSIGKYQSEYVAYMLSLRLVDVERGAVEATGSVDIPSDKEIRPAVAQLVERLSARISISGRVARVEEGVVYTTLGETLGVSAGDTLGVFRISAVTDDAGRVVMREETPIANLEVEKTGEEGSRCRVVEKSGDVEAGMLVRKGKAVLEQSTAAAAILVRSIPENARVFLDSQFIGVTPVRQSGLKPGAYRLEIRTEGYKAYAGRVTLVQGRTATVDRELEQESPAIEDILMLGRIPRRPTDPKEALRRALIPGGGFLYNGYPEMSAIVPMTLVVGGLDVTMLYASGFADQDSALPNAAAYANAYVFAMIGAFLFPYVTSLVDAPRTAVEEFRYPTYSEISGGGSLMYVRRRDLEEIGYPDPVETAEAVAGISNGFWGMDLFYLMTGRSYFIDFGLQTHLTETNSSMLAPVFSLRLGMYYKIWRSEKLAFGLGMDTVTNIYFGSGGSATAAFPTRQDVFPGLLVSYLSPRWEFDLTAAALSCYIGESYAQTATTLLVGPRARLDLRYFFGLRPGVRLALEYQHMWNVDREQRDSGLGAVNTYQMLNATLGIVYRF
jgi:hypothetical protein